ncbi:MAG: histidine kinase [Rhodobacter sp.]|nr:histidine kinase [Rhodobacter sp.]
MNGGRLAVGAMLLIAALGGVVMWYLQVYAFYEPVTFQPGQEIRLTPIIGATPEAIPAENATGIDSESSPIRFRACFTTTLSLAELTETYQTYEGAEPLIAPGWFDCFDARAIGTALERGEALAFLSEAGIRPGVNRVVAVFPDGRAYAWHQLNDSLKD